MGKLLHVWREKFVAMQQIFPLDVQQFSARRAMIVTIVDYEEKNLMSNWVK